MSEDQSGGKTDLDLQALDHVCLTCLCASHRHPCPCNIWFLNIGNYHHKSPSNRTSHLGQVSNRAPDLKLGNTYINLKQSYLYNTVCNF